MFERTTEEKDFESQKVCLDRLSSLLKLYLQSFFFFSYNFIYFLFAIPPTPSTLYST